MGALASSVGTTMAAKQALSIGNSNVKLAVISMTRTMPVRGARTTPVKNAAMPATASARGSAETSGNHWLQKIPKKDHSEPPGQAGGRTIRPVFARRRKPLQVRTEKQKYLARE